MSDSTHTTSEHLHTEPKRLSKGTYILAFIVLLAILVVVGDLFVFILGTIGLIVTFAAYYADSNDHAAHH